MKGQSKGLLLLLFMLAKPLSPALAEPPKVIQISDIEYRGPDSEIEVSAIAYHGPDPNITISTIAFDGSRLKELGRGNLPEILTAQLQPEAEGAGGLGGIFKKDLLVANVLQVLSPVEGKNYLKAIGVRVTVPQRARLHFRVGKRTPGDVQFDENYMLWEVPKQELVDRDGYFEWNRHIDLDPAEYYLIVRTSDPVIPPGSSAADKIEFNVTGFALSAGDLKLMKKEKKVLLPGKVQQRKFGAKISPGTAKPEALRTPVAPTDKPDRLDLGRKRLLERKAKLSSTSPLTAVGKADVSVSKIGFKPSPLKAGAAVDVIIEFRNGGAAASASDHLYSVSCSVLSGGPECPVAASTDDIGKSIAAGATHTVKLYGSEMAAAGSYRLTVTPDPGTKQTADFEVLPKFIPPGRREMTPRQQDEEEPASPATVPRPLRRRM